MIPSESLVQAAAEAVMRANDWQGMAAANEKLALELATRDAKAALAAAFAALQKLPPDERAVLIGFRRQMDYDDPNHGFGPLWTCDALTREFGEGT